jgi:CHAT domain-containing protein/Tfp pilus assembly protein PilF
VTMTQRLGSWFPYRRTRAVMVLACVCLLPPRMAGARPNAPLSFQNQPKDQGAGVRLEPGTPIEKELAGGATDSYEIQVGAGQFLHAVVDQMGIDVVLTLYGPDGKQIATMDSPNGTGGLEQISTIAESDGVFRLSITPGDEKAALGRYHVSFERLRSPVDADRGRIVAERAFNEAVILLGQPGADSRGDAMNLLLKALPLWRAAGDNYEESLTLFSLGQIYDASGEKQKALDCFSQHLALRRTAGDPEGQAEALNYMGLEYDALGEKQKSVDSFTQALPLWRSAGNRQGEAATFSNAAGVYHSLGEEHTALDFYDQALAVGRAIGNGRIETDALDGKGLIYNELGEPQKALEYFNQALVLSRSTHSRSSEAVTLNNIGLVYEYLGDQPKALEYFDQALTLERAARNRADEAMTLNNIGAAYQILGEQRKALAYFEQALPILHTLNRSREGYTLNNIGMVLQALGEKQRALDTLTECLALRRAMGDRIGVAVTLDNIGKIYEASGKQEEALLYFSEALPLFRALQDTLDEGICLTLFMEHWKHADNPGLTVLFGKKAVNRYQQIRSNISGLDNKTQQSFRKSREHTYRELADLLITQGRLPEAEQVLDLLKDEEYFEFIRRDSKESAALTAPVKLTKDEEAADREYEVNVGRVTAIGNEYAVLRSKPTRTADEEQHLKELQQRVTEANEAWEKFLTGYFEELGKTKEANESVESVKEHASAMQSVLRQLDPGTVALYTLVADETYRVIVITPNVMVPREYAIKADDLRKKVAAFRQALMDPASDPKPKAQELYNILVAPVAKELAGAKAITLMWSLDGVLRYLPMAALYDGHQYLVEKYRNTVFTPSSIPGLLRRPNVASWHGLGMGVSKSYGGFEPLPAVPAELHRVIRVADESAAGLVTKARGTGTHEKDGSGEAGVVPGLVMLDKVFTEENMEKALEKKYPLVHIASHFDFSPGNETESFLLLGGKDETGERLTLADLRNNPALSFRDTELLTLSACNTAVSGAAGDGREVDGLGVIALQMGARAVVASLWSVNDSSTGELMQQFYQLWTTHRKMPKAEALREAQVALLRGEFHAGSPQVGGAATAANAAKSLNHSDYSHPYYWAPFILIGNWR